MLHDRALYTYSFDVQHNVLERLEEIILKLGRGQWG